MMAFASGKRGIRVDSGEIYQSLKGWVLGK